MANKVVAQAANWAKASWAVVVVAMSAVEAVMAMIATVAAVVIASYQLWL